VTLILVVVAGVVNVPGPVNTCMFEKPPAAAAALVHVEPLDVSTLPDEPGATNVTAEVPAPKITLAEVRVDAPVPPLATGSVPVILVAALTKVVDVDPVPPLAIGKVPVTLDAKLTKVVDVEPVPPLAIGSVPVTLVVRFVNVVEEVPVPPCAIERGVAKPDNEVMSELAPDEAVPGKKFAASTTLVPLLNTNVDLPAGTAIPVPDVFLTVTASANPLLIRYSFSIWQPEPKIS
jgi:hypothetical protein